MPFRFHSTNPDTGSSEYLWVDEVSHVMIQGDDTSRETMRECQQNFSVEVRHFQILGILGEGINFGWKILQVDEVDPRILEYLKMSPKIRYRDTSFRIMYNRIVKRGDIIAQEL